MLLALNLRKNHMLRNPWPSCFGFPGCLAPDYAGVNTRRIYKAVHLLDDKTAHTRILFMNRLLEMLIQMT